MEKKSIRKEPLLFITQPSSIEPPKVKMQEVFSAKKAEETKRNQQKKQHREEKEKPIFTNRQEAKLVKETKKVKKQKIHYLNDLGEETGVFGTPLKKAEDTGAEEKNQKAQDEKVEQRDKRQPGTFFKRVKSFREMTTAERLDYLVHFPKQLPPVPCLFETEDTAVRGYLKSKTEDEVEVLLFNKMVKTLPVRDIKSVRMIGMN